MTSSPSVGQLIRDRLKRCDLTQAELASAMGMHPMSVHYLVNSKTRVTPNTAGRLARVLGESARWWLDRQTDADLATPRKAAK